LYSFKKVATFAYQIIEIMEISDLYELKNAFQNRLEATDTTFHRYLYSKIDWNDRLIGIRGAKGVGKTTLILQYIKENLANFDEVLYISLDNLWFVNHSLIELVDYFYTYGGKYLFIDEIHYFKHWQTALKNFYDNYPKLHIVFTGSSMLQMSAFEGDLSRRLADYELYGLSFREFLEYENVANFSSISMEDILAKHIDVTRNIISRVDAILQYFEKYLHYGYYPFYKETSYQSYGLRLQHVANHVLETDYPSIEDVSASTVRKAKKMLMILAEHVPQTPTMSTLYGQLETDRIQGLKLLNALQRAGLLVLLSDDTKSLKALSRPDKIFLNNTNLMYALGAKTDIGTVRETFFLNQLSQCNNVKYPRIGDFYVNNKYLFEVGGKGKTFKQIKDEPNSYLAIDDIKIGIGNRIPLWLFGFLY